MTCGERQNFYQSQTRKVLEAKVIEICWYIVFYLFILFIYVLQEDNEPHWIYIHVYSVNSYNII